MLNHVPLDPTARLEQGCHPACRPLPRFLKRKLATATILWITWNLNGCKAKYQWVIPSPSTTLENTAPNPPSNMSICKTKWREKSGECNNIPPQCKVGVWWYGAAWGVGEDDIYRLHHECLWMFKILAGKMTPIVSKSLAEEDYSSMIMIQSTSPKSRNSF